MPLALYYSLGVRREETRDSRATKYINKYRRAKKRSYKNINIHEFTFKNVTIRCEPQKSMNANRGLAIPAIVIHNRDSHYLYNTLMCGIQYNIMNI